MWHIALTLLEGTDRLRAFSGAERFKHFLSQPVTRPKIEWLAILMMISIVVSAAVLLVRILS